MLYSGAVSVEGNGRFDETEEKRAECSLIEPP